MTSFDWGAIKDGFSGFEKLAYRFVSEHFPTPHAWKQTKPTRDGNRDAYTIVFGYQPYPAKEEQWWMEAKYSTQMGRLTRYRLDATVVSAILSGNVSKVIFVTNIIISAKTVLDIRSALRRATNCKEALFCTKFTLEYWLSKNPKIVEEFFDDSDCSFQLPDLFVTEEMEFYSDITKGLAFREPLHFLSRGKQYAACFNVFSAKQCRRKIRPGRNVKGLTILQPAQLLLKQGENHLQILFQIERDYIGGKETSVNDAPTFLLGGCELTPKNAEVIDSTENQIGILAQQTILKELHSLLNERKRQEKFLVYCINGLSGTGKSYVLKQIARELAAKGEPLFSVGFTSSSVDNNRVLLDVVLFLLFPYLDPEEVDSSYLDGLQGCYIAPLIQKLVASRDSLDELSNLFSTFYEEDALFPVPLSINRRYVILDDLQRLGEAPKHFLLQLIINAKNRDLPVSFILSGQPDFFTGEFDLLHQKLTMWQRECRLTSKDIMGYLQTCELLCFHPAQASYANLFPSIIELFLFAQYLSTLKTEIDGMQEFLLACQTFHSAQIAEQYILDQFNLVLDKNDELKALCDCIYWSEEGLQLSYQDLTRIRYANKLLQAKLICYNDNNYVVPYHDIYKRYYRKHFSRPKNLPLSPASPLQLMYTALQQQTDSSQLWELVYKIADMLNDHKFYSVMYILEDSFCGSNASILEARVGKHIYYILYMCYALASTNVSRICSGRELFQTIREETKGSSDPILLEVCENATWELLNSLYEWLDFEQALKHIDSLLELVKRLQFLGRRDRDLGKCIRYHDAEVIRTLIESDLNLPKTEENYQLRNQAALDNGFMYRSQTFSVRYGLTLIARDMELARTIMAESMEALRSSRGESDRYYLWSGFAWHYLNMIQNNDIGELEHVMDFHKRLKKNFFNDYRKKSLSLAAFYYCNRQEELGNHYLFQEIGIERNLRSRQKAFYFETIALYEYLYGSYDKAQDALQEAAQIFSVLPDYLKIIDHNAELISLHSDARQAQFYCGGPMRNDIFYVDPRCVW